MATTEPFTVRTKPENLKNLDLLASATDRSRNYLVNAAIERYLKEEAEFVEDVMKGLEDVKAGRVTPHEEVFRDLRSKIKAKLEKQ